jgi:hypothetical protein
VGVAEAQQLGLAAPVLRADSKLRFEHELIKLTRSKLISGEYTSLSPHHYAEFRSSENFEQTLEWRVSPQANERTNGQLPSMPTDRQLFLWWGKGKLHHQAFPVRNASLRTVFGRRAKTNSVLKYSLSFCLG